MQLRMTSSAERQALLRCTLNDAFTTRSTIKRPFRQSYMLITRVFQCAVRFISSTEHTTTYSSLAQYPHHSVTITILFALTHCTISLSNRGAYPDSELFARAGTTFVIVVHLKSPAPHRCRCYVGLLHPALAPFFLPLLLPRSYSKSPTCARALISPIGSQSDTIEVHIHV